ncbi:MAG TPA: hypothetical protein PK322_06620 [Opitutaceae bacterium]|nr:hypothetical protein [Opitutaceae bacterium]
MTPSQFIHRAFFLLTLALLSACSPREMVVVDGVIEGNRYKNDSIGMRIDLPEGWEYDPIKSRVIDENCRSAMLFCAKRETVGGTFAGASIKCILIPDKRNMGDVAKLKKVLEEGSYEGEVKETVGQNDFAVHLLNKDAGRLHFTQHSYSMHRGNYTLVFVGVYTRETEKVAFKKSLETLSFSNTP